MKKVFCLLLCMLLVVCSLAACGGEEEPPHEHTYDTAWSSNATTHWYAPTCEHTDALASVALHVDSTNDGICDVCGYGSDHTHTYAAEWTMTQTEHYKKVTCGHNVTPKDKGAHVDEDNNKVCDTCSYDYEHTHTYSDKWTTTDAEYHWHDATCGCTIAPADKALHGDLDEDGYCDVCEVARYEAGHTHKEADNAEWQKDAENHWKVCADHEGYVIAGSKGAHVDVKNNATNAEGSDGVCDTCGWYDVNHKHSYAKGDAWSKNDLGHWYAAACGHTGVISGFAEHTPGDDGACTVCGYTEHEHVVDYTLGLQSNADGHWLAGKCDVADEANACDEDIKFVVDAHFDLDKDGLCDACYWVLCEHTFSKEVTVVVDSYYDYILWEEFTYVYHTYAPTCGCEVESYDDHEAVDINGNGVCDICFYEDADHGHAAESPEYVFDGESHWTYCDDCYAVVVGLGEHVDLLDNETLEAVEGGDGYCDVCAANLEKFSDIVTNLDNSAVNLGTLEYAELTTDYMGNVNIDAWTKIYEFGNEYYHEFKIGDTEYWYTLDNNGNVFVVSSYVSEGKTYYSKGYPEDGVDYFAGSEVNMGNLIGSYTNTYGVENTVLALINLMASGAQNFWASMDEETNNIQFGFSLVSYYYYEVAVSMYVEPVFVGEELKYAITSADIVSTQYSSSSYDTDEDTSISTLNDSAEVRGVYTYTFDQKLGDRTATTKHNADTYCADDYVMTDAEENPVESTLDLDLSSNPYYITLTTLSETANLEFDAFTYTLKKDGEEHGAFDVSLDQYEGVISIAANSNFAEAGTYTLELNLINWSATLTINATAPVVSEVNAKVYNPYKSSYEFGESTTVYLGNAAKFTYEFNEFATGEVTISVSKIVDGADPVDVTADLLVNTFGAYYSVTPTEVGTYSVTIACGEITDTFTVTVEAKPEVKDVLTGTWTYSEENYMLGETTEVSITFTPAEEGALNGTCVVSVVKTSWFNSVNDSFTGTYTYDETNGLVVCDANGTKYMSCFGVPGCTHENPMDCWPEPVFYYNAELCTVMYGQTYLNKQVAAE